MTKGTALLGFLLCFFSGALLSWGVDRGSLGVPIETPAWSDGAAAIPVDVNDPTWGSRNAPVTMVMFSDYQCPYCGQVETTVQGLKDKYGPERLRVVWKNNPLAFHENAKPAAIASETVFRLGGNDAFWRWHKLAFDNQKILSPERYADWASQVGVDKTKFQEAFSSRQFAAKVEADLDAGHAAHVQGTPSAFINGVAMPGIQSLDKFSAVIDEELAATKDLHIAPDKIYTARTNQNFVKAEVEPELPKLDTTPPPSQEEDKSVWKVPVSETDLARGPSDALVTIVEFGDFECPFCARVYPSVEQILKEYDGKVRFIWKERPLPMHARAVPAAILALEARAQKGDKGFWAAYNLMFQKAVAVQAQTEKNPEKRIAYNLEDADLEGFAKELGLDVGKVKTALKSKAHKSEIDLDDEEADDVDAQGTPHFFINGRRTVGAQTVEHLKALIDEEMKKAQGMVANGTAPRDVYAKIIEDGKEPQAPERKEVGPPPSDAPWKGNGKSKVVMQIFSDYQCPFCKRVEPTLKQVEQEFGAKIKIVWRDKPLTMNKDAHLAAQAGREVYKQQRDAGFWKFHDALFDAQGTSPTALQRPALEKIAEQQGIDMKAFDKALDTQSHKAEVDASIKAATDAQIAGTPSFVVNGYFVNGSQPYSKFKKAITMAIAEVEKAQKKLAH